MFRIFKIPRYISRPTVKSYFINVPINDIPSIKSLQRLIPTLICSFRSIFSCFFAYSVSPLSEFRFNFPHPCSRLHLLGHCFYRLLTHKDTYSVRNDCNGSLSAQLFISHMHRGVYVWCPLHMHGFNHRSIFFSCNKNTGGFLKHPG